VVSLFQYQEGVKMIDCGLHDFPHFSLGNMRVPLLSMAGGASFSRMYVFNGSIAKSQRD
jgi:hypothetical protein